MHERHINRKRYFEEQSRTSKNYYIPYIQKVTGFLPTNVLEVGCGEGGNLLPFAESGSETIGVDIDTSRIKQARTFFNEKDQKGIFIASDIFELRVLKGHFSLILIHDVIEHIENKALFLSGIKSYLSTKGVLFIAFPAWQMPFGGHQQIARGKLISHFPFIHLLPRSLYKWILKACGEKEDVVKELLSIKATKCTIETFRNLVNSTGYRIISQQLYFINPHYEVKFGLAPRKLNKIISSIPYLRNFFSTSCFYILEKENTK